MATKSHITEVPDWIAEEIAASELAQFTASRNLEIYARAFAGYGRGGNQRRLNRAAREFADACVRRDKVSEALEAHYIALADELEARGL